MSRAGGAVAAVVDFASHSYMTKWGRHMGGAHERINVTCREMRDIMREAGYAHAHFLSLDVQGAEEVVLRTADIRSFSTVLVEAEGTAGGRDSGGKESARARPVTLSRFPAAT